MQMLNRSGFNIVVLVVQDPDKSTMPPEGQAGCGYFKGLNPAAFHAFVSDKKRRPVFAERPFLNSLKFYLITTAFLICCPFSRRILTR